MPRTSAGSLALRSRNKSQKHKAREGHRLHTRQVFRLRAYDSNLPKILTKGPSGLAGIPVVDRTHSTSEGYYLSLESRHTRYGGASAAALNRTSLFTMARTVAYAAVCP